MVINVNECAPTKLQPAVEYIVLRFGDLALLPTRERLCEAIRLVVNGGRHLNKDSTRPPVYLSLILPKNAPLKERTGYIGEVLGQEGYSQGYADRHCGY